MFRVAVNGGERRDQLMPPATVRLLQPLVSSSPASLLRLLLHPQMPQHLCLSLFSLFFSPLVLTTLVCGGCLSHGGTGESELGASKIQVSRKHSPPPSSAPSFQPTGPQQVHCNPIPHCGASLCHNWISAHTHTHNALAHARTCSHTLSPGS
jgi:hypothetical protein